LRAAQDLDPPHRAGGQAVEAVELAARAGGVGHVDAVDIDRIRLTADRPRMRSDVLVPGGPFSGEADARNGGEKVRRPAFRRSAMSSAVETLDD
jgi:hypothetical protein